jgi:hypothetical protein
MKKSLLPFTSILLLVFMLGTSTLAQKEAVTDAASLKDTVWAWPSSFPYPGGTLDCFYSFGSEGKVVRRVIAIAGGRLSLGIDTDKLYILGTTSLVMKTLPTTVAVIERNGKYSVDSGILTVKMDDESSQSMKYVGKDDCFIISESDFPPLCRVKPK